jgi:outer membrane protein assembly factor BamB
MAIAERIGDMASVDCQGRLAIGDWTANAVSTLASSTHMDRKRRWRFGLTGGVMVVGVMVVGVLVVSIGRTGTSLPPQFQQQPDQHYAALAKHREAQRSSPAAQPATAPARAPLAPARTAAAPGVEPSHDPGSAPPDWTGFRGASRDGHYQQGPIVTAWPAAFPPLWKQPVGGGHASFAIASGRAFTIEQRGDEEVATAYDVRSGRELWAHGWRGAFRESMGGDGPRATPTWYDGIVYALGAEGELRALREGDGTRLWRTNILSDAGAANLEWGMAASPLVVDDLVIVAPGGRSGRSVLAYDRRSGRQVWGALDDKASYAAPQLATIHGVRQVLIFSSSRLASVRPEGGGLLWDFEWRGGGGAGINVAQPIVLGDRVFISTGYGVGSAMLQVHRTSDTWSATELWRSSRMKNQFTSSVHHDGFIYGLDEGILACISAADGERRWKAGRYGDGQVLLASGHLLVSTDTGDLVLVRATPDGHQEIARSPAVTGRTWNHPAIADGILLIRNSNEMAAFDLNRR